MFYTLKDPNATLDYSIDWEDWLVSGDSISSSTWYVSGSDSLLLVSASGSTSTTTTVWLDGGTSSYVYNVTNRITSACGRTDDRTIRVTIYDL